MSALPFHTPCCTIADNCAFACSYSSSYLSQLRHRGTFPMPVRYLIYSTSFYCKPREHHGMFYPKTRISETASNTQTDRDCPIIAKKQVDMVYRPVITKHHLFLKLSETILMTRRTSACEEHDEVARRVSAWMADMNGFYDSQAAADFLPL